MHSPLTNSSERAGVATPLIDGERFVFTVAEAGKLLGASCAFAYGLSAQGQLPVI